MGAAVVEESRDLTWVSSGGSGTSRWVDGSEVSSQEVPIWSRLDDDEFRKKYGSPSLAVKRRLVKKPKRVDSLDVEAMQVASAHAHHDKEMSTWRTLALAFQTLCVVYGDMGTSPLYVFTDIFSKVPITSEIDILGALSVIFCIIALVPLAKYVLVVLKANDNGEGGTFALYSLISRYAKVNVLPNRQQADEQISNYRLKLPTPELERALSIKELLEKKPFMKTLLLLLVLTGTSLIIGDGILTPAMSDAVVIVSMIILIALFSMQRFGTSKVGVSFAPALSLWFFSLACIGIYNLFRYDITVLRALNPAYIYFFFKKKARMHG